MSLVDFYLILLLVFLKHLILIELIFYNESYVFYFESVYLKFVESTLGRDWWIEWCLGCSWSVWWEVSVLSLLLKPKLWPLTKMRRDWACFGHFAPKGLRYSATDCALTQCPEWVMGVHWPMRYTAIGCAIAHSMWNYKKGAQPSIREPLSLSKIRKPSLSRPTPEWWPALKGNRLPASLGCQIFCEKRTEFPLFSSLLIIARPVPKNQPAYIPKLRISEHSQTVCIHIRCSFLIITT